MQVSRINGKFATPAWTPVHYMHQSISVDELLALYRAAEVMLVTPLRDGMNLVAKEFVATRFDESGTLILSEFAGAADDLEGALIVNPYDLNGVAAAMHQALTQSATERRRRMRNMRAQVLERNVFTWASEFLAALQQDLAPQPHRTGAAARP